MSEGLSFNHPAGVADRADLADALCLQLLVVIFTLEIVSADFCFLFEFADSILDNLLQVRSIVRFRMVLGEDVMALAQRAEVCLVTQAKRVGVVRAVTAVALPALLIALRVQRQQIAQVATVAHVRFI